MTTIYCNSNLGSRFYSHVLLGLNRTIQEHEKNWTERVGDTILWTVEEFPKKVWEQLQNARVMTAALTTLALLANSFLFYPTRTWQNLKAFYHWLPLPPLWAVRFASYLFTCALIIGAALRAYGRFSNGQLMDQFYQPSKDSVEMDEVLVSTENDDS